MDSGRGETARSSSCSCPFMFELKLVDYRGVAFKTPPLVKTPWRNIWRFFGGIKTANSNIWEIFGGNKTAGGEKNWKLGSSFEDVSLENSIEMSILGACGGGFCKLV